MVNKKNIWIISKHFWICMDGPKSFFFFFVFMVSTKHKKTVSSLIYLHRKTPPSPQRHLKHVSKTYQTYPPLEAWFPPFNRSLVLCWGWWWVKQTTANKKKDATPIDFDTPIYKWVLISLWAEAICIEEKHNSGKQSKKLCTMLSKFVWVNGGLASITTNSFLLLFLSAYIKISNKD